MKNYDFREKHVLITGATGGLGSALARKLAETGARLAVSARSEKALAELVSTFPETDAVTFTADLAVPGEAKTLAQKALDAMGHIDVLFNNAGIGYFATMEEAVEESIRHLFEVNTFAPLALIKTLLPKMKAIGGGRIVNIVSCAGRVPIPSVGVYGGSKSALAVMANTMRLELAPYGIDIINIYPGTTDTSFEENALREEARPGLCPSDSCGLPRFDMAKNILRSASGPPGEIWLEPQGKWLSTAAIMWPKYVDKKLGPIRDRIVEKKSYRKRRWRLMQVETSLACNLKCVMCPWVEMRRESENRGIMAPEVWEAVKPFLPEIRSVDFTGGGEPLLQPRLADWITEAKSAGCETGFLTNGLLLDNETARRLIDANSDWIGVSMDGASADVYEEIRKGSNFERVCGNLSNLSKNRIGKTPKIMINFVLMTGNFHQVEDIVRLASELGADQVNFKQCDVIRGDHGKGLGLFSSGETGDVRRLRKSLAKSRKLAKKLNIETTAFKFAPEERTVCEQDPRNSFFIRHDGGAAPCINLAYGGPTTFLGQDAEMPTIEYGNVLNGTVEMLWETETCQFYRKRFEDRDQIYDKALMNGLAGSSSRDKLLRTAQKAMPEPPKGCDICHYLYDI